MGGQICCSRQMNSSHLNQCYLRRQSFEIQKKTQRQQQQYCAPNRTKAPFNNEDEIANGGRPPGRGTSAQLGMARRKKKRANQKNLYIFHDSEHSKICLSDGKMRLSSETTTKFAGHEENRHNDSGVEQPLLLWNFSWISAVGRRRRVHVHQLKKEFHG